MAKAVRLIGASLLIAGTTIGAGMLALPISTSFGGFFPSCALLILCWLFMLASALFFLDVNLAVRGEPNLISMAGRTLGTWGKAVSWIFYLLLLYSLTAAYISGTTPLFIHAIYSLTGYELPASLAHFALPLFFGWFIYLGTSGVDYVNRILMIGLILTFILMISLIPSTPQPDFLQRADWSVMYLGISVVATSFGYHIIIPSLTTYMEHDAKRLRIAIIAGSAIPLIVYLSWQYMVMNTVPHELMMQALANGESATQPLIAVIQNPYINVVAQFFAFFLIVTSFLGVTLSLSDFLTDGFKIKKTWEGRLLALSLTFVPPLVFVYTYERGFYKALEYGGAFVAILLIFLPAVMAWNIRSHKFYRSIVGKAVLLLVMLFALLIFSIDLLKKFGIIKFLLDVGSSS